jgi:DNA polymerase-3 subunit gamma/tau
MWPEILDRVKDKRRVTWMLLFDKVQVLGLDGRALTLGFPDPGSVKGFTAGGHDEVLRQSVIDILGADWRIDCVHQPGGSTGGTGSSAPAPHDPGPDSGDASPATTRPPTTGPAATGPAASRPAAKRPSSTRAGTGSEPGGAVLAGGPPVEDLPADDDEDAEDSGLAGAELVARELGGRVIGEFGTG